MSLLVNSYIDQLYYTRVTLLRRLACFLILLVEIK
jgi:hypothetical protein